MTTDSTKAMGLLELRDTIAKAIADSIGHGMREKCEKQADAVLVVIAPQLEATARHAIDAHLALQGLNIVVGQPDSDWIASHLVPREVSDEDVERAKAVYCASAERDNCKFPVLIAGLRDVIQADRQRGGGVDKLPAVEIGFGRGEVVVHTGHHGGEPCVYLAPAKYPGVVGESSARENMPLDRMVEGESVLTFPTMEQAKRVADALCNVAQRGQVREGWRRVLKRALPFLDEDASKYEDDGNNEPLDVADAIRELLDAAQDADAEGKGNG